MNLFYNFAVFHLISVVIFGVNLWLILGLYYFPYKFGVYVLLPYLTYTKFLARHELKEGLHWPVFSKNFFVFRAMRDHLQLSFKVSSALEKAQNEEAAQFVFAIFPHGTHCDFRVAMDGMLDQVFPNLDKIRTLAASVLFAIPVVREIALWTGCVDARRKVADNVLKKGYSIVVLPGGEAEQIRTVYQQEAVWLKNRKGFIKLAMRHSIPVVPCYAFGTTDCYKTSDWLFQARLALQKSTGICIPFATGKWGSIFCPLPSKSTLVFGDPLTFVMKEPGIPLQKN